MISDKYKCIFIHIPKTGGRSIQCLLRSSIPDLRGPDHQFAKHNKLGIGNKKWDSCFKFTFVRNPWDKLVSQYFYIKKKGWPPELGDEYNPSFRDFILEFHHWTWNWLGHKKPPVRHNPMQLPWILDDEGKCMFDFVGRFEKFKEDIDIVCDQIGIPHQQLPHKNASKHKHYAEYYDDETRQIVAQKFTKDIEYFGYTF